jgi:hypothetical protein
VFLNIQFRLIVTFLLTFSALSQAQETGWKGPIPTQNQRPFQAAFLHFPAASPEVLPRGQQKLGFQLDIANNLMIPNVGGNGARVEEDFETQRLSFSYRRGLKNDFEAEVASSVVARNGGILDGAISFYHQLFGMDGNVEDNPVGRDNRERGRSVLAFDDGNGRGLSRGSAFRLGDTAISLRKTISRGDLASSARVGVKIPTGSDSKIFGSGSVDFGVMLDTRYRLSPEWALFGSVGAAKFGDSDIPNAKKSGLQGGLGVEYRKSARESWVAQIDAQTRTVTTQNAFADKTPILASVGYKRQINENRTFWASFSENGDYHKFKAPFFGNVGPDFTISLGFEIRH